MNKISAKKYKEMLLYGGEILEGKKEEINALNVFPVPDGDTGFNMNMTYQAGMQSIVNLTSDNISDIAKAFSKGMLMGARGNSGVILSQFFRGLNEGLEGLEQADTKQLYLALQVAVKRAYDSVIKAVEGTILTVAREMVDNTTTVDADPIIFFEALVANADVSLQNTPELLPILKEANVVDSGGAGLSYIMQGMLANLKGEKITIKENFELFRQTEEHPMDPDEIHFAFCTEMLLKVMDEDAVDINQVRTTLETLGDSIVAIADEDILKMHVHTNEPLKVFAYGLELGEIVNVKSENMKIQAIEAQKLQQGAAKEIGIVTVSSSPEMTKLFQSYADIEIVEGGQTLNPSIEDIAQAIKKCNASKVIVMPNNSNIIMAATAAVELVDVEVEVIKTKHITQAFEALANFNSEESFANNIQAMTEAIGQLTNVEITNAIKDTSIEGVEIKANDYLAIVDGKIKYSYAGINQLLHELVDQFLEEDKEIITFLIGQDGDAELVSNLEDYVEEKSPFTEVVIENTCQPVYSYLISAL